MEIKVPDLGVDSAEVSEIMVKVGDVIAVDDNLVLLESDKASVEVPATQAGKITAINVTVGDKVKEGDVIVTLEAANAQITDSKSTDAQTDAVKQESVKQESVKHEAVQNSDTPTANQPSNQQLATQPSSAVTPAAQSNPQANAATEQAYALPDLGVESAEISEWMVSVGDMVTADQPLVLVESDKASVEVPSPASGKVVELLVQAGDSVNNGQNFIVIETTDTGSEIKAEIAQSVQQPVASSSQVETKTAIAPQSSAQAPVPAATSAQSTASNLTEAQINAKHADVYAGPAVRKLTRQLGVDISEVKGSGINGRINKEDIFAYVKNRMQNLATPVVQPMAANTSIRSGLPNLPDMSKTEIWGETETQDLSRLQKVSIPQLNYNTYLPQVTQFDLSDITDTEKMRSDLKDEMKKEGISLTILAFIMKATAYALMQFPKFNSHLSDDNTQIIIRKTVNMGFAVATDDGLTVPVIQNVQEKGIKQLAIEIGELAKKARDKKLSTKELQGASFTISSQGNLGGTYFTPLINWPQVGILGVSESSIQPRWNEAKQTFEPRLMLPLSLSYDHRVINGADAAVFTRFIAKLLADPRRILL